MQVLGAMELTRDNLVIRTEHYVHKIEESYIGTENSIFWKERDRFQNHC